MVTHFTHKNHIKFHKYKVYYANHTDDTAHGGTEIIIKVNIKHHQLKNHEQEYLLATTVVIKGISTLNL